MTGITTGDSLSMESSFVRKGLFAVAKAITSPRSTIAWVFRGHLAKDPLLVSQSYWFTGSLPRVPLSALFPGIQETDVVMPRAFDRKSGTSISAEEACHLGAITRHLDARKVLEIGTYDGNTALLMAANVREGGEVVTVDLPPDFGVDDQHALAYAEGEFNLTPRSELARQSKAHPLSSRIRQVYADSGKMDWSALGGPFELIFIDGCHSEEYVRSDTDNALRQLTAGGVIVWHDYGMIPAVSRVVDELAGRRADIRLRVAQGTRLAVGLT